MLEMDAQNNITEVSKTSQFGLSQSIRGLAVVGIAALVFVVWGINPVDYLFIQSSIVCKSSTVRGSSPQYRTFNIASWIIVLPNAHFNSSVIIISPPLVVQPS